MGKKLRPSKAKGSRKPGFHGQKEPCKLKSAPETTKRGSRQARNPEHQTWIRSFRRAGFSGMRIFLDQVELEPASVEDLYRTIVQKIHEADAMFVSKKPARSRMSRDTEDELAFRKMRNRCISETHQWSIRKQVTILDLARKNRNVLFKYVHRRRNNPSAFSLRDRNGEPTSDPIVVSEFYRDHYAGERQSLNDKDKTVPGILDESRDPMYALGGIPHRSRFTARSRVLLWPESLSHSRNPEPQTWIRNFCRADFSGMRIFLNQVKLGPASVEDLYRTIVQKVHEANAMYVPKKPARSRMSRKLPKRIRRLLEKRSQLFIKKLTTGDTEDELAFRKMRNRCKSEIRQWNIRKQATILDLDRKNRNVLFKYMRHRRRNKPSAFSLRDRNGEPTSERQLLNDKNKTDPGNLGKSLAPVYQSVNPCSRLPLKDFQIEEAFKSCLRIEELSNRRHGATERSFSEGQKVLVRDYNGRHPTWIPGFILRRRPSPSNDYEHDAGHTGLRPPQVNHLLQGYVNKFQGEVLSGITYVPRFTARSSALLRPRSLARTRLAKISGRLLVRHCLTDVMFEMIGMGRSILRAAGFCEFAKRIRREIGDNAYSYEYDRLKYRAYSTPHMDTGPADTISSEVGRHRVQLSMTGEMDQGLEREYTDRKKHRSATEGIFESFWHSLNGLSMSSPSCSTKGVSTCLVWSVLRFASVLIALGNRDDVDVHKAQSNKHFYHRTTRNDESKIT
ncbi:hypothetical protein CLF_100983 [Clonorchis sinensis]|uniref:Uncharacterized protein n=1 Tax=Clonorchis sinensis TaxID=79923 RepID=G7Y4R2_CLOSI|nr:hypothetical protein CLF_100983 [Clonorchis sinensis]